MGSESLNSDGIPPANRDEPIPVLRIRTNDDDDPSGNEGEPKLGRRERLWGRAKRIREGLETYGSPEGRQSVQDRVFASIISQIIPTNDAAEDEVLPDRPKKKDGRAVKYADKPEFGPRLMAYNFRRFNARIGVVFVLQNRIIYLLSWRQATATLSFLAVYSLVCLNPQLLPLVPLAILLFSIMIPAFMARHPTPANDPRITPSFRGPPTAPASKVKPAPDLSSDFWRNMRDLQNSMEDFSRLHDAANDFVTPHTNFSDEALSSTLFVGVFVLSCVAFVGSHLVPWRLIVLVGGWLLVGAGHPAAQKIVLSTQNISNIRQHIEMLQSMLRDWIEADVLVAEPAEVRQVEIFELQKHHFNSDTWESWLFSPSPYDPLSPARMDEQRPRGTQFFEDVQAPAGWTWKEKKWSLDLFSREWIEQRMITGVEIETEGERWVYDLPAEKMGLLGSPTKDQQKQRARSIPQSGWEEGSGLEPRGEWRRRRWTRMVEKNGSGGTAADKQME